MAGPKGTGKRRFLNQPPSIEKEERGHKADLTNWEKHTSSSLTLTELRRMIRQWNNKFGDPFKIDPSLKLYKQVS